MARYSAERRVKAFWAKVKLAGPNDCWLWLGSKSENGYGRFWTGERCVNAQVFAYEIKNGKMPNGKYGCHTCDNPSCVNPKHVFAGTPSQNQIDCVLKGRKNFSMGSATSNAKFTESEIVKIRNDQRNHSVLGRVYGVDRATIRNIRNRTSWIHVP